MSDPLEKHQAESRAQGKKTKKKTDFIAGKPALTGIFMSDTSSEVRFNISVWPVMSYEST